MGENTGQVGEETLVNGQDTLLADSLQEAVQDTAVEVTGLVVHAGHDCVYGIMLARDRVSRVSLWLLTGWVHKDANDETRCGTGSQVQSRALLHTQMVCQTSLGEEVCGKLDSTSKRGTDHGGIHAAVDTLDTLALIDSAQPVEGILVVMLSTDGKERRI